MLEWIARQVSKIASQSSDRENLGNTIHQFREHESVSNPQLSGSNVSGFKTKAHPLHRQRKKGLDLTREISAISAPLPRSERISKLQLKISKGAPGASTHCGNVSSSILRRRNPKSRKSVLRAVRLQNTQQKTLSTHISASNRTSTANITLRRSRRLLDGNEKRDAIR